MKNLVFATIIAVGALGMHTSASAQDAAVAAPAKPLKIGGEGALVIPSGDWGDFSGIGFGVMGRLDYMVGPKLAITGHPGYIFHTSKDINGIDFSTSELLLTGGVRFFATPEVSISAETGINMWAFKASANGMSDSETENRVPLMLGGGYTMPTGLTLSAQLLIPNLLLTEEGEDMQMGIMFNVGYLITP